MKQFFLLTASLLMSIPSFAQWVKPTAPASTPLAVGTECYLYNKDTGGFLVGANDWGTRASISPILGHKVIIENGTEANSYYISNHVLQGGMAGQIGYMFFESLSAIWVDNTKTGKPNNQYTFVNQGDGTYKIGLSDKDPDFQPKDYPDVYLGINTTLENDTRLYFCDPENSTGYTMDQCNIIWYFVTPENYEAFVKANKPYLASVALKEQIDKAKAAGLSTTEAETVYNNTSSTAEALDAATAALISDIRHAAFNTATVENPYMAAFYDFSDGSADGWTSTTGASNKQASNGNNAKDFTVTGNHYENWNGDAFTPGKVTCTVSDVLPGVYHLTSLAFTNTGSGVNLYAGSSTTEVTATSIDKDEEFDVYAIIKGNTIDFGLDVPAKGPNWIGLDNVKLEYLGTSKEAFDLVKAQVPEYDEGVLCTPALYTAYVTAKNKVTNSNSVEALADAMDELNAAIADIKPNIEAYINYELKSGEVDEFIGSSTAENEAMTILSEYLYGEEEPAAGVFNGNGSLSYIMEHLQLSTEQIIAETAYLSKLYQDALASSMNDGDDCTNLLANPNFKVEGGWKGGSSSTTWPKGNVESFPVVDSYNVASDVYQSLEGLQDGLYEMTLQAAFRPGDTYSDSYEAVAQAYAYINDFEVKIPSGKIGEELSLNSAEDASSAFAEGRFPVTVYGLVTDGTMRIGFTNKVRTVEACCLWAGGVKLVFRGKNPEVLASVVAKLTPEANELTTAICGNKEIGELQTAIEEGKTATDGYKALKNLKVAMDAVKTCATSYANLKVATDLLAEAIANSTTDEATIRDAQKVLDDAVKAYNDKSLDFEAAEKAISIVNSAAVAVKIGKGDPNSNEPVDYTKAIVNNNFDPTKGSKDETRIEGWTTTAMNGYKSNTVSYNKKTFALSQKLSGLPKGNYKVTVHTYYRAGSYEEEEANIIAGKETHLCKMYAQTTEGTVEKPVVNLSEGAKGVTEIPEGSTRTINGITVPDGTGASVAWFNAGHYLNELNFSVGEDGTATIGLHLDELIGSNDYIVVGEWNLWFLGDNELKATDYSMAIVNNTFDPTKGSKDETRIEGWTTTAMNGYKSNTVSYNKKTFALSQKLSGLPEGTYKVTVHTYYRAGSYEEEEANINDGKDTHLCKMYAQTSAQTYEKPVVNLSEGAKDVTEIPEGSTRTINGITVPDGTGASVAWFNAGHYLNELPFYVGADGTATIGLHLDELIGSNDYIVVGEWNLYYYGSGNNLEALAIEDVEMTDTDIQSAPASFYTLSGSRISAPQKGINIVRMSNGKTVKILVK